MKTVGAKNSLVISAASGFHEVTKAEQNALEANDMFYRGITTLFGYMREAQFPLALALAALSIEKNAVFQHSVLMKNLFLKKYVKHLLQPLVSKELKV